MITENLQKASHSFNFAQSDLAQALKEADPVQSLRLPDMIRRTSELKQEVDSLLVAIQSMQK